MELTDIIGSMEQNFYSYLVATFGRNEGVSIMVNDKVIVISSGLVGRTVLQENEEAAVIELIMQYFANIGAAAFSWWVGPGSRPAGLAALLRQNGFRTEREEAGMVLNLEEYAGNGNRREGFIVSQVDSVPMLEDYLEVFSEYWDAAGSGKAFIETYRKAQNAILQPDHPVKLYVGYLDGKPVTSCELFLQHNVAGVYAVTTKKALRKRGLAGMLLDTSFAYARRQGYHFAVLQATPAGLNLYRKLGFNQLCVFYEYKYGKG
jgi:ribosomal protein S18 acetylase RimI-like enzyme